MKLQFKILLNSLKSLMNIHTIFYLSLIIYFFVYVIFNQYNLVYFQYIFGIIDFKNHFSVLLLLLNISYLVIIIYQYLTYEIKNFPLQIVLRENAQKWFLQKTFITILYLLLFKFNQFILFGILGFLFLKVFPFNLTFYLSNILLFIIVAFITIIITYFKNPLKYTSILLLIFYIFYNKYFFILIIIMFILELVLIFKFNFKDIIHGYKI